jgi:hypothetical protein
MRCPFVCPFVCPFFCPFVCPFVSPPSPFYLPFCLPLCLLPSPSLSASVSLTVCPCLPLCLQISRPYDSPSVIHSLLSLSRGLCFTNFFHCVESLLVSENHSLGTEYSTVRRLAHVYIHFTQIRG